MLSNDFLEIRDDQGEIGRFQRNKYRPDHVRTKNFDGSRKITAFFDCVITDDEHNRYLSEDYMFCQYAQKIGIDIWLCPWMRLTHTGTYTFGGSLVDLAQIGASATVGKDFKPRKD